MLPINTNSALVSRLSQPTFRLKPLTSHLCCLSFLLFSLFYIRRLHQYQTELLCFAIDREHSFLTIIHHWKRNLSDPFRIKSKPTTTHFDHTHPGKDDTKKLSLSIDSIETSPQLETHRRSKSILKNKSEASRLLSDPESERLLADNMSGSGVSDNGANMVNLIFECRLNEHNLFLAPYLDNVQFLSFILCLS